MVMFMQGAATGTSAVSNKRFTRADDRVERRHLYSNAVFPIFLLRTKTPSLSRARPPRKKSEEIPSAVQNASSVATIAFCNVLEYADFFACMALAVCHRRLTPS